MTREQLVARLRVVEEYLSAAREMSLLSPDRAGASPVEQDFVAHDALRMLDRGGTPAFIYELEDGLRILDANHAFAGLTGYFGNDLWALCLTDLLDLQLHPKLFRMLAKPRPKGFVETGVWQGRAKNNEARQVIASGHDLVFQARRARFVVLHSAREPLDPLRMIRDLIASFPTPAYIVTPNDAIDCWNPAATQALGYTAGEMNREPESKLFAAGLPPPADELGAPSSTPLSAESEVRLKHANGSIVTLLAYTTSVQLDGTRHAHRLRLFQLPPQSQTLSEVQAQAPAQAPEWRWEQNEALCFTHVAEESFGQQTARQSWLGRTLMELPARWQAVEDKRRYQNAVDSRLPFQSIELLVSSDGHADATLLLSGGPRFDERGQFRGYHGIARDITPRRAQEAQLQLLASLLQHTEDAVMALSTDMALVSWNPGAQRLLGYSRSEIIGKRLNVLCADSDGSLLDDVARVARSAEPFTQRLGWVRHRDGEERAVAATCSVVRSAQRRIVGLALVVRDARHTGLPARALSDENIRLRLALDGAQLHLWEMDSDLGHMRYDDSLPRLLGYEPDELPQDEGPFAQMIEPTDAPNVLKALRAVQNGESAHLDAAFRAWKKNGEQIWLQARGRLAPEVDVDAPRRVLGTCADITPQKHQDQSRRVLAVLAEAAGVVIFSLALDGLILSWSPGAEAALGYRAAEIIGNHHDRLVPEASHEQHAEALRQLQEGAGKVCLTTVRRHRDNSMVMLDCVLAPIREPGGELREIAFMGHLVPLTHNEDPPAVALEQETPGPSPDIARGAWHLARLVESCRDAIISVDMRGLIESFNPSAEKLLGYEREEVIALPIAQLFDTSFVDAAMAVLDQSGPGQPIAQYETRQHRRDGQALALSVDFFPLVDECRVVGAACIMRDIRERQQTEQALKVGEVRFRSLVEATHQAVWIANPQGEMVAENPSWQRYTGQSTEEARGHGWLNCVHPDDREHAILRWSAALAGSSVYECPQRVRRLDGQWRDMIARAVPVQSEGGEVLEWIGIHIDITEQRQTENALRESESRLQSILNSAAEGIIVIDSDGIIERMNVAAQRMFGCNAEDHGRADLKQLIIELDREFEGADSDERYASWLRRMIGGQRDLTGRRRDGRQFPLELSINEVSEAGHGTRFVGIVRDVTERKSWEARIFQLAYSDSLTGLPNRLLLVDRLEQAVAGAQRNRTQVGVLFFDFDGFKLVNDRYGHHTGDLLLKGMSERIRNCVREIDTVSRLGGDEFVVVLPELKDGTDAGAVARKIIAALSQPYSIEHQEISITLTAGISVYPGDGESAEILIRHADTAMYFAKESGKNRFRFFNPEIQALH